MTDPRWRVAVVDRPPATTRYGYLAGVTVTALRFESNRLDTADIVVDLHDPSSALLFDRVDDDPTKDIVGCLHRELQITLDGTVLIQGPAPQFTIDAETATATARVFGATWWLHRRNIGRADRTNLMTNGSFEDSPDFDGWATTGTPAIVTSPVEVGSKAAELDDGDVILQAFTFEHTYPPGLEPRFTVGVYLPSGSDPPDGEIWAKVDADDGLDTAIIDYDSTTFPTDVWQNLTFGLGRTLSAGVAHAVTLTLLGGAGGIVFDDVRSAQPESVGAVFGGSDPADVGVLVVDYLQDPAHGKDDVGITGVSHPVGETIDTVWQDSNHERGDRVFAQLTETGACDWWEVASTRAVHFGARGSLKTGWRVVLGENVAGLSVTIDGAQTATSAVVIGVGNDFTRDEGGAVDVSSGLPIIERVDDAPVSMELREYDRWAAQLVAERANTVETITATPTWGLAALADLAPGDTVPVDISIGTYQRTANLRITALTVDPATGTVRPELGAVPQ